MHIPEIPVYHAANHDRLDLAVYMPGATYVRRLASLRPIMSTSDGIEGRTMRVKKTVIRVQDATPRFEDAMVLLGRYMKRV